MRVREGVLSCPDSYTDREFELACHSLLATFLSLHSTTMGLMPPVSNSPTLKSEFESVMEEAKVLMGKKDQIEQELRELEDRLLEAGIGMTEPLVDAAGFPRAEIDVHTVRINRNLVIRLRNDLKAVMKDIENVLYKIHQAKRDDMDIDTNESNNNENTTPTTHELPVAFAIVNAVAPDSPAYTAGLRRNDHILKFGTIDASNNQRLNALNIMIGSSENQSLPVALLREGQTLNITVTPKSGWGGRGTLGCHLLPL